MKSLPAIASFVFVLAAAQAAGAQDEAPPPEESGAQPEESAEVEEGAKTGEPDEEAQASPAAPEPSPDATGPVEAAPEPEELAEKSAQTARDRWMPDGKFMDTRVTFVFADDNTLAGMADRSPKPGFMDVDDEQFNEGLDSEKRGRETETQLVLYKRLPSYFRRMDAEAALVLEMQSGYEDTRIGDDGSYLKLNWYTRRDDYTGDVISLTMFPMDSQRFLLGYTYDITWGGEKIFPNNKNLIPGAKLQYDFNVGETHQGYVFAGMKTARLVNSVVNEAEMYYGALSGFGINFARWLGWDVNGGYFQRGVFPPQDYTGADVQSDVAGEVMDAFGFSTRLVLHQGIPITNSVDFRLYKVTPDAADLITEAQKYTDGFSWSLSGEFTNVWQNLMKVEDYNSTELMPSKAAAVNGKLMYNKARLNAFFVYRDLSYVVFDIPGVFPYHGFAENADVSPEWFISAGIDYFFETPHLTPGVIFGYKRPSVYSVTDATGLVHNYVYRDEEDMEILPAGEDAFDILTLKGTLKWDVAPFFAVIGELRYTLDKNMSKMVGDDRVFQEDNVTNQLGFAILAQAKW